MNILAALFVFWCAGVVVKWWFEDMRDQWGETDISYLIIIILFITAGILALIGTTMGAQ